MKSSAHLILILLCLGAVGCARSYFPTYVAEMSVSRPGETGPEIISERGLLVTTHSYREDTALVEDDLVTINAALHRNGIWIGLTSKTDQPLEIIWAEATVFHNGITETLLPIVTLTNESDSHLPTFISKGQGDSAYADKPQAPLAIEPLGWVSVLTAPRSFFAYVYDRWNPQGGWSSRGQALFDVMLDAKQKKSERAAAVAGTVGKRVVLFIPLRTAGGRLDYTINLTVHSAEVGKFTHYIM